MKKILLNLLVVTVVIFTYNSCDDDPVIFDNVNGQTAAAFTTTSLSVTVPPEGITVTLPINVTTVSTSDRTFNAEADLDASTAISGSYSIGTATIPAGSYDGSLEISLNTNSLSDGILYSLVVDLVPPAGSAVFNETATIEYNKEIVCNDVVLTIVTDAYAEETGWDIRDASGNVVESVAIGTYGPAASAASRGKTYTYNINLPDGCYTLNMYDLYGDGQFDGGYSGSYSLTCSILTHASGEGSFGATESTEFCINP